MNRRLFLSSLFGAAAAVAVDPERLLWTPGAKLISIPAVRLASPFIAVDVCRYYASSFAAFVYTITPRVQPYGKFIAVDLHSVREPTAEECRDM